MTETPHDALFKAAFSRPEYLAEELRCILPAALLARMDLGTLAREPGSFVDEALRERHTDILYSLTLDGRPARIYVLLEHQSRDDAWMALRLLRYMLRIWDGCVADGPAHLPVIIPIVLYHGDTGWRAATRFEALVDPPPEAAAFTPHFGFALDDLTTHSEVALHERAASAFTRLVLLALRQTRSAADLVALVNSWKDLIHELLEARDGRSALSTIFRYIYEVQGTAAFAAVDITAIEIDKRGKQIMESMAQYLRRTGHSEGLVEGRNRGLVEGRNQGRVEGQRKLLLSMLARRFGAVPAALQARVEAADDVALERWADRLFTAPSLAELFAEP